MGVKYSASESSQLMEAMSSNIQVANEVTDRLSQGCDHLIATLDSGELMGAAYTAGKGLFSEIIIPAIKKLQAAVDDIQTELNSYRIADAQVSEYGNLDLDQLKKTKELREKQLASIKKAIEAKESFLERMKSIATFNIVSHMESLVILSSAESQIETQIKELEEKIEKLEFFVAQVSQYFSDSLEVLRLAIQGATQLSEIIVDSDGNYYADGVDMNWVKKMKEQKIESIKYDSSKKTKDLHKEYQSILDKLEKGKELSDKEFETLESYARRYPKVQLPEIVTNKLKTEAANRANPKKLQEKVEKIKKSDKTSIEKADQIVKAYEDYLFYNNREAFEEYWRIRSAYNGKWDPYSDNPFIREAEGIILESVNRENIRKIVARMGDDVLDVKKIEDKKKYNLIQRGRSTWKSPGDNGLVDNAIAVGSQWGALPADNLNFMELVNTGQPLDLKTRVYREDYPFSIWSRQWEEGMESDYLGNYLFGYVGKGYLESSDTYLKVGAGMAQGWSDKNPLKYLENVINGNYGDNPGDAKTIQDGINDYRENYK